MVAALARFVHRFAAAIVAFWVLLAAAANLAAPQLEKVVHDHSRSFFPADAPSSQAAVQMGQVFGDSHTNNAAYVVLEGEQPLGAPDRAFYDRLVAELRADPAHVESVMDLWSQPLATAMAESPDGKLAYVLVRLKGEIGSSEGTAAVAAVRATASALPRPDGLQVYVTGPGPTIVDSFEEVDRQLLLITAVTVVVIAILLYLVYRSVFAAAIPLITVGLGLAVARPLVAVLGAHGLVEVSIFSVALMSAMVLGAGTDYAIFVIGRYHENRRAGLPTEESLIGAYCRVAPVVAASALTIAAALACLVFSKVSLLRSAGIPCSIGVLTAMAASLTLLPAILSLASRRGLVEPRASKVTRRWRRIGTAVARWPGPLLVAGSTVLVVFALPLAGIQLSYDVPRFHSADVESNLGYTATDRHFPPNQLLPETVLIRSDHDLRNPAGLIAIERVTRQVMSVRGVRSVLSASRPAGVPLTEASLAHQSGLAGAGLASNVEALTPKLDALDSIQGTLDQLANAVDVLDRQLGSASAGLARVGEGTGDVRSGVSQLQDTVAGVTESATPLRQFADTTPNCPANPVCSMVLKVLDPLDSATRSLADLSRGADQLATGTTGAATAVGGTEPSLASIKAGLGQLRGLVASLRDVMDTLLPQLRDVSNYLSELSVDFQGSGEGGFYLPQRAFDDPRFNDVSKLLFSDDGKATRLLVYGDGRAWSTAGAHVSGEVELAVHDAIKEGTLAGSSVSLSGVGSATRDLNDFVDRDFILLTVVALTLVFAIVAIMLRSPVAGVVVVATVVLSYASALGASVLLWWFILGHEVHFAVPSLAFIALVAVGADYNLLLAVRIKEESGAGLKTAVIRAFGGTGGVVTTAGIVFGLTMFAMLAGNVLSIAQVGTTIGIGLIIDTLVVRTIIVPALVVLLGRWFWWPARLPRASSGRRREPAGVQAPLHSGATPAGDDG